jgi:hypothetical protein
MTPTDHLPDDLERWLRARVTRRLVGRGIRPRAHRAGCGRAGERPGRRGFRPPPGPASRDLRRRIRTTSRRAGVRARAAAPARRLLAGGHLRRPRLMLVLVDSGIRLRLLEPSDPQHASIRGAVRVLRRRGDSLVTAAQNAAEFGNVGTRPVSAHRGYGLPIADADRRQRVIE